MFILHFSNRRNLKCPIKFSVEDRAKCQVLIMYSLDDVSCTSPAALNVTKPLPVHHRKYESSWTNLNKIITYVYQIVYTDYELIDHNNHTEIIWIIVLVLAELLRESVTCFSLNFECWFQCPLWQWLMGWTGWRSPTQSTFQLPSSLRRLFLHILLIQISKKGINQIRTPWERLDDQSVIITTFFTRYTFVYQHFAPFLSILFFVPTLLKCSCTLL